MFKTRGSSSGAFRALILCGTVSAALYLSALPLQAAPAPKPGYQSFIVGNPAGAPQAPGMSAGLVLMGGGLDVDEAYQWMCQRAGGGDHHDDHGRELELRPRPDSQCRGPLDRGR